MTTFGSRAGTKLGPASLSTSSFTTPSATGYGDMPLSDEDAAALAISALAKLSPEQEAAKTQIDTILKAGDEDSFVDIHELFGLYNVLYFRSLLLPRVEVSWSQRLTL
jgi:hypothetical protein